MRRHSVKPGITGWAQINGRNALSWEDKFELDLWYVEHKSLWLDIKTLFITMIKVFKCADTTAENGEFMKPFRGTGDKMVSESFVKKSKQKENML
jgi:sugar transferase EpsL